MLITTFKTSVLHHFTPWKNRYPMLRSVGHTIVYCDITMTNRLSVLFIKSSSSFLLSVVWELTAKGIIQKLFFWHQPEKNLAQRCTCLWVGSACPAVLANDTHSECGCEQGRSQRLGCGIPLGRFSSIGRKLKFWLTLERGFVIAASAYFFCSGWGENILLYYIG